MRCTWFCAEAALLLLGDFLDDHLQSLEVDGFGEMLGEAGFVGFGEIFLHSKTGERDGGAFEIAALAELPDQVDAAAIGQSDVAEKQIER